MAWSPSPVVVGLGWLLGAGALAWTVLGTSPPGQLLTGVAAIALLLLASYGTVARPRLAVDSTGIAVRQMTSRRHWPWRSVRISVSRYRRFGRQVALLEIDGEDDDGMERLAVLGRLDLGADPEDVIVVLRQRRPRRLPPGAQPSR